MRGQISSMNVPVLWSWLALLMISLSICAMEANCTNVPRDAQLLLAIKQTYNYLSLDDWVEQSTTNFCNWTGVTCDGENRRNVVALNLQNKSLSGSIPPELNDLHHLASLNLSYNSFQGSIPSSLFGGPNSSLSILSLAHNQISGTLPSNLFNSTDFQYLDFSYNHLGGFIPPRLGLLSNLHHLNLCQNNFVGPIPLALSNNTKLTVLDLCFNSLLNGTIPAELGLLSRLEYLCLDFNDLTGTIPTSIPSNCTQLRALMIGNNRMSGNIPVELGKLRYLEQLYIDVANFQGPMPSALGNVTTLRLLAIYRNSLTGTIPKSLGQLSNVVDFLISANFFTGSLPPELGNLTNVQYFNVRRNLLTGSIPSDYGRLNLVTRFVTLDNELTGRIPSELGNCSSLAQLWLSGNRLSGRIPEELGQGLTHLAMLYLDHNDLSGTIPESLSNCTNLQDLNLGYNRLQGSIPPAVANLKHIVKSFSMPRNLLTGNIPVEIGGMMLVTNIDLAGNLLSGQIPASMESCVEVLHLNLSGNRLEGQVPLWFRSMITLTDLDLSDNQLSGPIPPYLGDMVTLLSLNVSYNHLSGPIPNKGVLANRTAASFLGNEGLCGPILGIACPAASGSSSSSSRLNKGKRLAIIFSALVFGGVTAAASVFCSIRARARGKSKKKHLMHPASMNSARFLDKANPIKSMTTTELYEATGGFNPQNIVGSGKTATVYRGCLPDGKEFAIKRFKADTSIESFRGNLIAELRVLAMTRHRNLVRVLGYCNSPGMASVVMEMMPNGTLAMQIQEKTLDWESAVSIAVGMANGLLYLHKEGVEPILHCDLKPSNILLDFDLKPAIADFGLSRILKYGDMSNGFSTSNIKGSIGYMAPEYAAGSRITSKVDVYSYGIILLEMVSSRSPTCELFLDGTTTLRQWVVDAIGDGNPLRAVAPQFFQGGASNDYSIRDEMIKVLYLGLACSSDTPQNRPSMIEVAHSLSTLHSIAVPKIEDSLSPPGSDHILLV